MSSPFSFQRDTGGTFTLTEAAGRIARACAEGGELKTASITAGNHLPRLTRARTRRWSLTVQRCVSQGFALVSNQFDVTTGENSLTVSKPDGSFFATGERVAGRVQAVCAIAL